MSRARICVVGVVLTAATVVSAAVPERHPRLLGNAERLRNMAASRPEPWARTVNVARRQQGGDHEKMISMALVCAVESDAELGHKAVDMAMKYITAPVRRGHVTFGSDLARCAVVYDLCYPYWTAEQRAAFRDYMNRTVDANVNSETHVFHNGWYGYKNWGIGLACYATYYENPRAAEILRTLRKDWLERAAPALQLAGAGGGWAEGYYINYWLYEWLFFCEAARLCDRVDYYADAPDFFRNRAVASMFEVYPTIREYGSRRSVPMGDGGGRLFGGDRDKTLASRRILTAHYRDSDHRVVHAFNETTPRSSVGVYAYKDFLWGEDSLEKGDLQSFRLSHISTGPGYVYARSSWDEDATYFFFKCGDRFTAHQHLDVGNFLIFKHEELVGDGGHYDDFGSSHDVNYHLRTIAHNTVLVHDPDEKWPGIRAGKVTGNDGGQHHNWPHHNGAVVDPAQWLADCRLYDIADITAFEDRGDYLYVAGDCTRAYAAKKLALFTRQIVFLRPGTFVIFDRVKSTRAQYSKTWLLQAMAVPQTQGESLVVTNGQGRLFVQPLLPRDRDVRLCSGADLYSYEGREYPPARDTGPAPQCRVQISPTQPAEADYFLNILTAADADTENVELAVVSEAGDRVGVTVGDVKVEFGRQKLGGTVTIGGQKQALATKVNDPAHSQ